MFIYGKMVANAIAVMSYLAAAPERRAGSQEIARIRRISQPLTSKILSQLAAAGLISGQPGPGGGYTLARNPAEITLFEVASLFGQIHPPELCPFGSGWCGHGDPCPLHDQITGILESNLKFMHDNTFEQFVGKSATRTTPANPSSTSAA